MSREEVLSAVALGATVICLLIITTFGQDVPACDRLVYTVRKYFNTHSNQDKKDICSLW